MSALPTRIVGAPFHRIWKIQPPLGFDDAPSQHYNAVMRPSAAPESPWYASGLRFSCTQCGRCCGGAPGYVWVDEAEIRGLAATVGMEVDDFVRRHTHVVRGRRSLREFANGDCHFLVTQPDGRKNCGVYGARPLQCRTWPFWQSNVESPAAWKEAGRSCPGIDRGEHHALPVIQDALTRNAAARLNL